MKTGMFDVIILGGGASGMMAAITAAREGASVLILEHIDRIGKKILSTGNGKCNLSNRDQSEKNYRGENPQFAHHLLSKFGLEETLLFFQGIGIYIKDKNGYLYPNSEQASSVVDVLRMEVEYRKIKIEYEVNVREIKKENPGFLIFTDRQAYKGTKLILATGGMAAPVTGSDGSGYKLAKSLGHKIIPPVPALVQLKGKEDYFKSLSGVRVQANICLYIDRKEVSREYGEVQFVNYGISGIPVFQLSRYAARGIEEGKNVNVVMDFFPEFTYEGLVVLLKERIKSCPYKKNEELLIGMFNKKLAFVLLKQAGISLNGKSVEIKSFQLENLAKVIKGLDTKITAPNSFEQAQVCAGGVDTNEINKETLESKKIKGLYFAGELIDIDGACGGYNLQWAWTTGHVAGFHSAKSALETLTTSRGSEGNI